MNIKHEKVLVAHEDDRRALMAIFNGDFKAEQIKIIKIKKTSILGNHYHSYGETFFFLKGNASYILEDVNTKERVTIEMSEGDRLTIAPFIAHRAEIEAGTIIIEATEKPYYSAELNDVRYEL